MGTVELLAYPVRSIAALRHRPAVDGLMAMAQDNLHSIARDRAIGCGAAYVMHLDAPQVVEVGGTVGVRWSLTGTKHGTLVEIEISYAAVVASTVYVIHAGGLAPAGCLPREGEFTPATLEAFRPVLDLIARGSTFK